MIMHGLANFKSITHSEHVFVALDTQHAEHMRHILLSSADCLTPPYFSTSSHNKQNFQGEKKVTVHKIVCFDFFYNFILRRIQPDIITDVHIIIFINCNWVITRWQCLLYMSANMKMVRTNMKMVNTKFKTGGLHEKHVVATWNLGNHLSICL